VSVFGPAAVRGLQGKNLTEPTSVVACAKHFVGDGDELIENLANVAFCLGAVLFKLGEALAGI
jgi:hypothetical protein